MQPIGFYAENAQKWTDSSVVGGMYCHVCYNDIPQDSLLCPKCGVRLWNSPPPPKPLRWILLILLVAAIWSMMTHKEVRSQLLRNFGAQIESVVRAMENHT